MERIHTMIIRTNQSAQFNLNRMKDTTTQLQKTIQKLSSGFRINQAGDDAAGLAVSEKLKALISESGRTEDNVLDGVGVAKTADGALEEVNAMLLRAEEDGRTQWEHLFRFENYYKIIEMTTDCLNKNS